jgi:hypothetical protein
MPEGVKEKTRDARILFSPQAASVIYWGKLLIAALA